MAMSLPSGMLRPVILLTCLCVLIVCALSQHRASRRENYSSENVTARGSGIDLGNGSYLSATGNTHHLSFRVLQSTETIHRELSAASIQRMHTNHPVGELKFPDRFRIHKHSFREGDVSFFVTTGYIAEKHLFFQRIRCDHPGSLNVKATLTPCTEVGSNKISQSSPLHSALWLLPFESEVVSDDQSLIIEGEGELLLLWQINPGGENETVSWQSILREEEHPDLSRVANTLEAEAAAQPK